MDSIVWMLEKMRTDRSSEYRQIGDGNPVGRTPDCETAAKLVRLVPNRVQTRRHSLCDTQLQF